MNILHVINAYSPVFGCGPADRCQKMAKYLASNGHRVTIFTTTHSWDQDFVDFTPDVEVIGFPYRAGRFCYSPGIKKVLAKRIREFDIVHLMNHWTYQNIIAYRAVRKAGIPYVFSAMGALPIVYRSIQIKKIYNLLYGRRIIKNADALIGITKSECRQYKSFNVNESKIHWIPNAIDLEEYSCDMGNGIFRNKYNIPKGKKIILFLGRLSHIKGPDILLDGFINARSHLKDAALVFVGPDYGMEAELRKKASEAGMNGAVLFCGPLTGDMKRAAYADADIFVVPSRQENMSIVAVESCASETPVVITDTCDFEEIEEFGAGRVVPVDSKAIIQTVIEMLSDPDDLKKTGGRAKEMVDNLFTWDRIGAKVEKLLQEIVQKN